ncbi:MAG: lasso peptide biosynthesis B2 protein [Pseudomonadota bacterium]
MTESSQKPRRRDVIKWPHLVLRGVWELALARRAMSNIGARDIRRLNDAAIEHAGRSDPISLDERLLHRVGFIITFTARYVPWRSDCLPQAIAAQHWLSMEGIASEIRIGVERPEGGDFGAHAWLVHEETIVTGGEIAHFSVLMGEDPAKKTPAQRKQ